MTNNMKIHRITYVSNIGIKERDSSASVNRIKNFNRGNLLNGIQSTLYYLHKGSGKDKFDSLISFICELKKANKNDIFIFYGDSLFLVIGLLFKNKIKVIVEKTEYPVSLILPSSITKKNKIKEFASNYLLRFVDGFITCSDALEAYYRTFLKEKPIFVSPLIIDIDKFANSKFNREYDFDYIGFCGHLGNNQNGVDILIKSFASITGKYKDIKLLIVGSASKVDVEILKKLVSELKISEKVIFTGLLPHDKIPGIIKNARLLALPRPSNKQAEGGIPSKVGEYMVSGVPFAVTNVGELDKFLIDKKNCFMAEPNSVHEFSAILIEALEYKQTSRIVENAYETAKQYDIRIQSKLLLNFLDGLS